MNSFKRGDEFSPEPEEPESDSIANLLYALIHKGPVESWAAK